ncbi:MAG: hypothetical protein FWG88_05570 [Oscillospiraceae bacterium]|nr:hypothetical protein [Oscillospiraceae bacterium]
MSWSKNNSPSIEWPVDKDKNPVPPAFLSHIHGGPLDIELYLNLLGAYGIPHIIEYPKHGLLDKVILGSSSSGIEIYVPSTMLEDAQNVIDAQILTEDFEEDDEN